MKRSAVFIKLYALLFSDNTSNIMRNITWYRSTTCIYVAIYTMCNQFNCGHPYIQLCMCTGYKHMRCMRI